jgi:1,4-dihydroxy-2-naphthoyl-CoA hydrolase
MIWKHQPAIAGMNAMSAGTLNEALGIEFTEFGPDYLKARMPVDSRTVQPFRILHGGASGALAETLGSVASVLCVEDPTKTSCVGIELSCSHLRSAREGTYVTGTVRPFRIGNKIQVWNIEIHDDKARLVCISRLTIAVVQR